MIRIDGHWHLKVAFTLGVLAGYVGIAKCRSLLQVIRCLILDAESPCKVVPFTFEPFVLHWCLCLSSCLIKPALGPQMLVLFFFLCFFLFHLSQCKPICAKARQVQNLYLLVAFQTRWGWRRYLNWICACMQPLTHSPCSLSRVCASICEQDHLAICTKARRISCEIMMENFSKGPFCLFGRFNFFEGFMLWSSAAFLVFPSERLLVAVWWCSLCCLSCASHVWRGTVTVHLIWWALPI